MNANIFTHKFWFSDTGVLVRAVRTFAQTAVAMMGVSSFSVWSVDWKNVLGVSLGSALLSLLMSLDRTAEIKAEVKTLTASAQPPEVTPLQVSCGGR